MGLTLIDDWRRKCWRLWSNRLNAVGLTILGWVHFDPVGVLAVWSMMPPLLRDHLPNDTFTWIAIGLFILAMVARLVVQPKLGSSS